MGCGECATDGMCGHAPPQIGFELRSSITRPGAPLANAWTSSTPLATEISLLEITSLLRGITPQEMASESQLTLSRSRAPERWSSVSWLFCWTRSVMTRISVGASCGKKAVRAARHGVVHRVTPAVGCAWLGWESRMVRLVGLVGMMGVVGMAGMAITQEWANQTK